MRRKVKVISVPTSSTKNQLETEINTQLSKGWTYMNIVVSGQNWFIIFEKTVVS